MQVPGELVSRENELQVRNASSNSEIFEIQYSLTPLIKNTPNYQKFFGFQNWIQRPMESSLIAF